LDCKSSNRTFANLTLLRSTSKTKEKETVKGNIRLTNNGIIRFHGKTELDQQLVGFTGTYAPGPSDTLEVSGMLLAKGMEKHPGPH
jgi:hypothetical protein